MPRPFTDHAHTSKRTAVICLVLAALVWGGILATHAYAREGAKPIPAPEALLKARDACPAGQLLRCRAALRRALEAVEWQRKARQHAKATTVREITLDAINWASAKYGVSASDMRVVGNCESHLWPFATNGQFKGWAQLGGHHLRDPIFNAVPWQDAYATASHVARYVKRYGWGEWQCRPQGGLRW